MITLNNNKLCENCFSEISSEPCPHCGFLKSKYRPDPIALAQGSVLSQRYMIGGVVGKGGFGITYLAYDLKLDARVAVKEYYPMGLAIRNPGTTLVTVSSKETEESFRTGAEKFYNEAKMVAKFNGNPNIVSVYDFFYENDTVYFIMGYLQGQTLKSYIKTKKITEGQAVSIFNQITNALLAPHSMNILHRDISPDNIMLCDDRTIRLLDFGAARQVVAEQSQSLSVILKQGYAPLEQYQQKGKQGPWTDIYALGATIYTALTGEMLTDPMSRLEDDSEYAGNKFYISESLWNIIYKCTRLKIQDRYQDIAELKADLNSVGIEEEAFTDIDEEITDFLRGEGPEGGALGSNDVAGANAPGGIDPNATVLLSAGSTPDSASNETVALSPQEAASYTGADDTPAAPAQQAGRQMTGAGQQTPAGRRPVQSQQPPKKKGLHPVLIVFIIIFAILLLGIVLLLLIPGNSKSEEASSEVSSEASSKASSEESTGEKEDTKETDDNNPEQEENKDDSQQPDNNPEEENNSDNSQIPMSEVLEGLRDENSLAYAGASEKGGNVYFVTDQNLSYGAYMIVDDESGYVTEIAGNIIEEEDFYMTINDPASGFSISFEVKTGTDKNGEEFISLTDQETGDVAVLYRFKADVVLDEMLKYQDK